MTMEKMVRENKTKKTLKNRVWIQMAERCKRRMMKRYHANYNLKGHTS